VQVSGADEQGTHVCRVFPADRLLGINRYQACHRGEGWARPQSEAGRGPRGTRGVGRLPTLRTRHRLLTAWDHLRELQAIGSTPHWSWMPANSVTQRGVGVPTSRDGRGGVFQPGKNPPLQPGSELTVALVPAAGEGTRTGPL